MPKLTAEEIKALLDNPFTPEEHRAELEQQLPIAEVEEAAAQNRIRFSTPQELQKHYPGLRPERAAVIEEAKQEYERMRQALIEKDREHQRLSDEAMMKQQAEEERRKNPEPAERVLYSTITVEIGGRQTVCTYLGIKDGLILCSPKTSANTTPETWRVREQNVVSSP